MQPNFLLGIDFFFVFFSNVCIPKYKKSYMHYDEYLMNKRARLSKDPVNTFIQSRSSN